MERFKECAPRDGTNIVSAQLSQAGELISVAVSRIPLEKEADLRLARHRLANVGPHPSQLPTRNRVPDHACPTVISAPELATCQDIEQSLLLLRSCQVPARNIVMKEQRQVTIRAISLADEEPIERLFRALRLDAAGLRGECQRQCLLPPVFVM